MTPLRLCLVVVVVAVAFSRAQQLESAADYSNREYVIEEQGRGPTNSPPPLLALNLELPKEDAPSVPFYHHVDAQVSTYPVPSDELQVPSVGVWNPSNDPNFFYPHQDTPRPESQIPTNLYPKKYLLGRKVKIPKKVEEYVLRGKKVRRVAATNGDHSDVSSSSSSYEQADSKSDASSFSKRPSATATNNARSHFQMHGFQGPNSYKWGYDTGKGRNRHFRYEERDNDGYVTGHYGYTDSEGKLQMVHYDADPEEGFHASTTNR